MAKFPQFSATEAATLLHAHYGIRGKLKPLVSYVDQNFYVYDESNGQEFVLKISYKDETKWQLDLQHQAMAAVANSPAALICQRVHAAKNGQEIITVEGKDGDKHLARLLTWLPGRFMADAKIHSPAFLQNLGRFMGNIDLALANLKHPAAHRETVWDLKNAAQARKYLHFIRNPQRRTLADYFLLQFETNALPVLPELRSSIIHNDGNDYNVLATEIEGELRVSGIIDFGDMIHSYTVFELAITMAYAILGKKDILEAAANVVKGYHQVLPLAELEISLLFYLVCARLCTSVCMSAKEIAENPQNEYIQISEKLAWEALEKLVAINPRRAENVFRSACGMRERGVEEHSRLLSARKKYLGRNLGVSYQKPLKMVQGAMQYLFEENGETYLDCVNNVCHVGHCHPRVVRAAQRQMAILNTNTRYLHDFLVEYAEKLTATFPEPLSVCYFTCSGSEANDLALRLARNYTGQQDIIVVDGAYHGTTTAAIELSPYKFDGPGGKGAKAFIHKALVPDPYRGKYRSNQEAIGAKYAANIENIIRNLSPEKGIAAFICESMLGCGGQVVLPEGYLHHAFAHVRQAGGLCIADEVQVGFGRAGSHFWAFESQGVVPDIVTLGKPIGNGHPLAAVVTTPEIADAFNNGMEYFNTFGGNPVSCAVGLAVLDAIETEQLQENARKTGAYFIDALKALQKKYALVGDVRGMGLFIGAELVNDLETLDPAATEASLIVEKMRDRNILLSTDGPLHNVLKIKPPLVFNQKNVDFFIKSLDEVMASLT